MRLRTKVLFNWIHKLINHYTNAVHLWPTKERHQKKNKSSCLQSRTHLKDVIEWMNIPLKVVLKKYYVWESAFTPGVCALLSAFVVGTALVHAHQWASVFLGARSAFMPCNNTKRQEMTLYDKQHLLLQSQKQITDIVFMYNIYIENSSCKRNI